MPPFDVHFPLTAPGSEAGQAIERLEERLDSHVGLGEDQMLYLTVEADDLDAAKQRVLEGVRGLGVAHLFDLTLLQAPEYISVQRYRIRSGNLAELRRRLGQGFAPLVMDAPGFKSWHFVEVGDGTFFAVRVFAQRTGLQEAERRAEAWVHEALEDLGLEVLDHVDGDVLVHREAGATS
jgi:hypothetical protein